MAEAQSRLSPKLIAGAALVMVLAGFAFSRYFGSDENTTPPSPAYEAMMADTTPEGYRVPPTREQTGTPGATGAARLSGADESAEEEAHEEPGVESKKRKNRKKKARKESEKDDQGIYRFEDGKVDRKKMPPMGG